MDNRLLIVDDNNEILKQLSWGLKKAYKVTTAKNAEEALRHVKKSPPKVITLDLGLPPDPDGVEEGFHFLGEVLSIEPSTKVIVITGKGEKENAFKAISMGAYDFFSKPIDLGELKVILERAFQLANLEEENRRYAASASKAVTVGKMVGQCTRMQDVFKTIEKIAPNDIPVLILGESGTGKELVARAIHSKSLRLEEDFVPINCGAIPENLLESELFGHEKGAFTGAQSRVLGKVEYAAKGTLFLDEIGEMSPTLQVKVLRFLQEGEIQRVGGRETIKADARVITATNIDINEAIADGRLREDLYYRIGVITIELPPLRDRGDDILLLSNYFLHNFSRTYKKNLRGFSSRAIEAIQGHDWPGNVRELENKVKRAVIMANGKIVQPGDLGFPDAMDKETFYDEGVTLKEARARLEINLVSKYLEKHGGNMSKVAEALGVSRPSLYDLMRKHNLKVDVK